ncbi:hypothetical protein IMCC3317_09010 [Kordia antarctica]|uniref:DUF937 domain-containing protein n=1 Tax=Kordia antarctica TaxID=1218801 RepID=A0A7L4ZG17_9FLAO|nr:DUF937 domain-containing protein [Kordia antarctica]QHI35555.1 hypothetical protein IMCC3317_09010 [Kordia antarctica]
MSGILDLLNSDLGKQIIGGVSNEVGEDQGKTAGVLSMALPVLMSAMKRNASTPQGAEGLNKALENKHDGSILDNLGSLFGGGVNQEVKNDGDGILRHVLGDKRQNVEKAIGRQSGMDASSIANILKVAAPILMGVLGKQKRQQNVQSSGGIGDLLGGLLGGGSSNQPQPAAEQSFLESILDADNDGSVMDDIAGMLFNSGNNDKKEGNSGGGLGGLLGGLFGGK